MSRFSLWFTLLAAGSALARRPCRPATTTATVSTTTSPSVTATSTSIPTEIPTATTSSAQPTYSCDRFGYLSQNTDLYQVDLETGSTTRLTSFLGGETNAIGYNVLDNLLYGRRVIGNDTSLVRISAAGGVTVIRDLGATVSGNVGDVDTDGNYWMSANGGAWWKLDLVPGSATYGQVLDQGTADNQGYNIADWVYIPLAGPFLWAVATNSTGGYSSSLLRFNMQTHVWSVAANYTGTPSTTWGAMYGINTGIIYASDNGGGEIWMFPVDGSAPQFVTQGPRSGVNDGARCVLNVLDN